MKVLLINGSPRANGNTFTALSEVAKTLNEEGGTGRRGNADHADAWT